VLPAALPSLRRRPLPGQLAVKQRSRTIPLVCAAADMQPQVCAFSQARSALQVATFVSDTCASAVQESEYAAWVLVNGANLNHATVSVHRLQGFRWVSRGPTDHCVC